jgi:hypothetical protein
MRLKTTASTALSVLAITSAVTFATAFPSHAQNLICDAPLQIVGQPDTNPVTRVEVSYFPADHAWRVFHHLADGRVVSRSEQYAMTDATTGPRNVAWQGVLRSARNLTMFGMVMVKDGTPLYVESIYDTARGNAKVMQSMALCNYAKSSPPVVAATEPGERMMVPNDVSAGHLNLRSGPGTNFALLGSIPAGTVFTWPGKALCVPRQDGIRGADWCKVNYNGTSGWASRVGLMPLTNDDGDGGSVVGGPGDDRYIEPTPRSEAAPLQPKPVVTVPATKPMAQIDSVPIYPGKGYKAVRIDAIVGGQPLRMTLDTGATVMLVTHAIADKIVADGQGNRGRMMEFKLADGSSIKARSIVIGEVRIGNHVVHNVEAGVADSDDMLMSFPVLDAIAPFTIDTRNNRLVFDTKTAAN